VLPLDRGAAGRVLLAYAQHAGSEYAALRENGYALSRGERDPSCAGIAAPVFGPAGQLAGALSLSGPGERFSESAVTTMHDLLIAAAVALTRALGGEVRKPASKRRTG
jgi:DNA-binding IclR family transcriptional regulator